MTAPSWLSARESTSIPYLEIFIHARCTDHDAFVRELLEIFLTVPEQDRLFSINRSDYMIDGASQRMLQIEMNTISVAFPALSQKVTQMHKELISGSVLENACLDGVVLGFVEALKLYGSSAAVLMVVRPEEYNTTDQDLLVQALHNNGITVFKRSLRDISNTALMGNKLFIDDVEIGVVYYRAGYTESDYPSHLEWNARLILEQSDAIKCPDVGSQLAGTKKVQQELAQPGVLERFLTGEEATFLKSHFAGLWGFDDQDGVEEIIHMALSAPDHFVLKPQREGGGNNLYGQDMVNALRSLPRPALSAFILMELIRPEPTLKTFLKAGHPISCQAVSELGIYGVYLSNGHNVLADQAVGYLVRSKAKDVLEGGVSAGFAVLDSIQLIDQ